MGYYVHVACLFEVGNPEALVPVAQRHLDKMSIGDGHNVDAWNLLAWAASSNAVTGSGKGDMFHWGGVGNYTNVDRLIGELAEFFQECWRTNGVLYSDDRVLFITQEEQTESAVATQLSMIGGSLQWQSFEIPVSFFKW